MVDRTYYNFIRPHQALNGLTPSEMAGINLGFNGGNRWLELIKLSANNQNNGVKKEKKKWEFKPKKFDRFILKVFDKDNNELDCKELGFKKYYDKREKAQKFVDFYKDFHPNYIYKIEENN